VRSIHCLRISKIVVILSEAKDLSHPRSNHQDSASRTRPKHQITSGRKTSEAPMAKRDIITRTGPDTFTGRSEILDASGKMSLIEVELHRVK
jgi:hypothetical protein